jgi:hypothetical protein
MTEEAVLSRIHTGGAEYNKDSITCSKSQEVDPGMELRTEQN